MAIARAMANPLALPRERDAALADTRVVALGSSTRNPCARASRGRLDLLIDASARRTMFSRTVVEKRNGSREMTAICERKRGERHVAHVRRRWTRPSVAS